MTSRKRGIDRFRLRAGQLLASRYEVVGFLGSGWEGEVYKVVERATGVSRAAKLFYPQRNERNKAASYYAKKLDSLKDCRLLIKYHHSEEFWFRGWKCTALISEYVEGVLLDKWIQSRRGKRLHECEALQLLYVLAKGLEEIHQRREYHGDLHSGNVFVQRRGIHIDAKLVDMFDWGRATRKNIREDVVDLVRTFHEMLGGTRTYRMHRPEIKAICCGLKRSLLAQRFPTAGHLRAHLDGFSWEEPF
ncbi:MAG: protein kinase [Planctomycetota bacterium]